MRLLAQLHHLREVLVVDVRVHAEQPLEDRLRHRQEVLGERYACNIVAVLITAYNIQCDFFLLVL